MAQDETVRHVVEPEKRVPIAYDVDVAVVGAGFRVCIPPSRPGAKGLRRS